LLPMGIKTPISMDPFQIHAIATRRAAKQVSCQARKA
jgi:hypothetical protein